LSGSRIGIGGADQLAIGTFGPTLERGDQLHRPAPNAVAELRDEHVLAPLGDVRHSAIRAMRAELKLTCE
jgi:hypothetical protein